VFPSGPPFGEVRVDPRDGMVVHFAPPPEPQTPAAPGRTNPPGEEPRAVSGEATRTDWHTTAHEEGDDPTPDASSSPDALREPGPEPPAG